MSKQESVKVSIPKEWIKKIFPFVLTSILSVSGFASYDIFSNDSSKDKTYQKIIEMTNKSIELESRISILESTNRTILVQLSDIKEQNKATQSLIEQVLLQMASR